MDFLICKNMSCLVNCTRFFLIDILKSKVFKPILDYIKWNYMMMLCCCEVNPNVTFQTRSANFKRSQIKELYELAADDIMEKY
jgi:hypothetical protein